MAVLKKILAIYSEVSILNTLNGKLVKKISNKKLPYILDLEKIEGNEVLFSDAERTSIRIKFNEEIPTGFNGRDDTHDAKERHSYFKYFIWISKLEDLDVEVKYLEVGEGKRFNAARLDIGFGDKIIAENKGKKIEAIGQDLEKQFVFSNNKMKYLFIETMPHSTESNFILYGLSQRAYIKVLDNKWMLAKIVNKPFPKKYADFVNLQVVKYQDVLFVEESKAKEAYEAIIGEAAKGNTLISLWQKYSDIQLNKAIQLKDKLGEIKYHIEKYVSGTTTRIRIKGASEITNVIEENKDNLLGSSFELVSENQKEETNSRFKIHKIISKDCLELYDELGVLPKEGGLQLSIIGDEIIDKRRKRALKSLTEDRRLITRNLLFAIEGATDSLIDKKRKIKALTERTKVFLQSEFGIEDLTENQKEAVRIAINTPGIAIIQGPPGTGKSTVVAAICDRLIEIAEKSDTGNRDKLILVSAFQNDTVEHIASKIYTLGLPTIKIGKETQSNIRAEDKLIENIQKNIDDQLQRHLSGSNIHRKSKQLKDIFNAFIKENDSNTCKAAIEKLKLEEDLNPKLFDCWDELNSVTEVGRKQIEKKIKALKGLRTTVNSYTDDGYEKVFRLLQVNISFEKEEKEILDEAPLDTPSREFLEKLNALKNKYLVSFNEEKAESGPIGVDESLKEWISKAIKYLSIQEQISYEDEDTFIVANLEAIREELEGNTGYLKEAIKNYGESLAATNQVSGSYEMSAYAVIENVILEEAARSNPLDLLIPMAKASERIIMVGDQKQLPHLLEDDIADETAVQISVDAVDKAQKRKKLEESLFGVIFNNLKSTQISRTITLTEQFRMHPFIGDFISKVYYEGKLKAGLGNQAERKKHNLEIPWAKNKVAIFCDVKKSKGVEVSGKSKSRPSEATRIVKMLEELELDPAFENLSVGVITFYSKQVAEIFEAASKSKNKYAIKNKDGSFEIAGGYKETNDGREKLRIGSVDSFQGKEFDVVILSTVRSNKHRRENKNYKKIFGFLSLENRLNVAFSRAQKMLIVVGDGEIFSDEFAQTYVEGLHEFYNTLSLDKNYGNRIQ